MSKILVLSNQKGGVGKSTLAILIANHLASEGKSVGIIELDIQKSITNKRIEDEKNWSENELKYDVTYQQPENIKQSEELVQALRAVEDDAVFIVDLPGKLDDETLVPFLVSADYVLCPFQYETMCLESTTTFIRVIGELNKRFNTNTQLVFCPNNIDRRIGTKLEQSGWTQVDAIMSSLGLVMPRIGVCADLRRLNTFENTPHQKEFAERFLQEIVKLIDVKS